MATAGTVGYVIGSLIGWGIGFYGGRPFLERRGRWVHLTPERLDRAESWFGRYGDWAVLLGRVMPVVRSFISIPAGVLEMPLFRYTVLTAIGSAVWCFGIAGAGVALGSSWEHFHESWRYADYAVALPVVLAVGYGAFKLVRRRARRTAIESTTEAYSGPAALSLTDVRAQYAPLLDELKDKIAEVLDSGSFILGPEGQAFEEEAARFLGAAEAVGVANGTDALVIVLDALGVGQGDEVICPSFTFYATAESIARRGATPVFADIDPATLNLEPSDVAARVTERPKAILPVHLFGGPFDPAAFSHGVPVVEDAAQAFGSKVGDRRAGSLAAAATFSFYPTKNLFGVADGGLVTTRDSELADRIRLLRFHGSRDKQTFDAVGHNP